jgi:hypothetical protein
MAVKHDDKRADRRAVLNARSINFGSSLIILYSSIHKIKKTQQTFFYFSFFSFGFRLLFRIYRAICKP